MNKGTTILKTPLLQNNLALAGVFHRMADCYRYLGNAERFRAIAYEKVAKVLHNMKEDIAGYATDVKTLDDIGGIGESIAEKIIEYLHTGSIKTFEALKKQVPYQLLELMDITGFGPATLKVLHEKLQINNREDLIKALEGDKLSGIKGFGPVKSENMKRALKLFKCTNRMLLKDAEKIGNEILAVIVKIPGVQKAALAGSLRRKKETIGDIDIVIVAEQKDRRKIVEKFVQLPQVEKILAKGSTKATVVVKNNLQIDIRLVHGYEYGAALLYFTGSREHNIKLRTIARNSGYKINEYGIFDAQTNKRMAGETEEEMYQFLNLKYIPPEERLDKGEIERAMLKRNTGNGKLVPLYPS
jgi:DNA polymerase (family X)